MGPITLVLIWPLPVRGTVPAQGTTWQFWSQPPSKYIKRVLRHQQNRRVKESTTWKDEGRLALDKPGVSQSEDVGRFIF